MSWFSYNATAGGNTNVDGINIAEGMPPGNVNNAMRAMMADSRQFQLDTGGAPVTGGTGDNYTLSANQAFTGYSAGMRFAFRFNRANISEAPTLNVNGQGQRAILVYRDGQALPPFIGDIIQNGVADVIWSPADNGFIMQSAYRIRPPDISVFGPALIGRAATGAGSAAFVPLGDGMGFSGTSLVARIGAGLSFATGVIVAAVTRFATQVEAETGVNNVGAMTPLRTRQALPGALATTTVGQLGSYALLTMPGNATVRNPGFTTAGSTLEYANTDGGGSTNPPGTWRLMGVIGTATPAQRTSLWLRIS